MHHETKPLQGRVSQPWDPDHLRTQFVQALSDMYRTEVPLYDELVKIVRSVDDAALFTNNPNQHLPPRHRLERHGAIRLGTQHEMRIISRLFAVLGMHPVGYYDLSIPGVSFPLHGTAFRPTTEASLHKNPFRVFTTVLRPDLIASDAIRQTATSILQSRTLFSPELSYLLDKIDVLSSSPNRANNLSPDDAQILITESLKIFQWQSRSTVPQDIYLALKREHPIIADIVCFPSAHINHLTPRTLDIDAVQREMVSRGLPAKESIEGPPGGRKCQILLRQTSFKALEERVVFPGQGGGEGVDGTHTARFGEVEQRGAAVTRRGRDLYDSLLAAAAAAGAAGLERGDAREEDGESEVLKGLFEAHYPDDWTELRRQKLVFFRYRVKGTVDSEVVKPGTEVRIEELIKTGVVECEPITYEDFLPFSAAGIFRSNLGDGRESPDSGCGSDTKSDDGREELEALLGRKIPSEIDMYEALERASIRECEEVLGLHEGQLIV